MKKIGKSNAKSLESSGKELYNIGIGSVKAGAYLRVSTQEQAETGFSLDMQQERITAQIKAKGWEVYKVYNDGGQSGGKLDRPALQEMLADIEAGEIQAVVVYKLDRLSRKQRDTMYLIEDIFIKNGITLVSVSESLDTSNYMGIAMIGVLSVFAQMERGAITDRLSTGRKQKAKTTGGYCGGNAPIGFTNERNSKALTVNESQVKTVQRTFSLKEKGLTLQAIADTLNAEGHTTKQGASFKPTQVKRILDRKSFYSGTYIYSGIEAQGQHQAIL